MPSSTYVVASAAQLGGNGELSRDRSKRQTIHIKLDISCIKNASHLPWAKSMITSGPQQEDLISTSLVVAESKTDRPAGVYFSPIQATLSTAMLSPPLLPPSEEMSPASVYTPAKHKVDSAYSVYRRDRLVINSEQLNLIVRALVEAPLVKSSLQNQHLCFKATDTLLDDKSAALYSISNKQFATRQAQEIAPVLHLLNGRAEGACLFANNANANLVTYTSAWNVIGATKAGESVSMSLPDGLSTATRLEYCSPGSNGIPMKVILQSVHAIVERNTGNCTHFLSVETQVTESFKKAAIKELARASDFPADHIEVVASGGMPSDADTDDWFALADQLQASYEAANLVDDTLRAIRSLDATKCAMQTLTLMTELSRMKSQYCDALVLVPGRQDGNGPAKKASVPYFSQSLDASLTAKALKMDEASALGFTRYFIGTIVDAIYPCSYSENEFDIGDHAGLTSLVKCIPMHDGISKKPKAWAVFVGPRAKHALLRKGHL